MGAADAAAQPAPAGLFVGRDEELSELHAALRRAAAGRPEMILVAGEAGVGKSRLIGQFAGQARRARTLVAVGGAAPLTGGACRTRRWCRRCGYWPAITSRPVCEGLRPSWPGCWPS